MGIFGKSFPACKLLSLFSAALSSRRRKSICLEFVEWTYPKLPFMARCHTSTAILVSWCISSALSNWLQIWGRKEALVCLPCKFLSPNHVVSKKFTNSAIFLFAFSLLIPWVFEIQGRYLLPGFLQELRKIWEPFLRLCFFGNPSPIQNFEFFVILFVLGEKSSFICLRLGNLILELQWQRFWSRRLLLLKLVLVQILRCCKQFFVLLFSFISYQTIHQQYSRFLNNSMHGIELVE